MKQKPLTTCPTCDGTGRVEIEGALLETLSRFNGKGVKLSSSDIHDPASGTTQNAANNRLEKLRRMGLLTRARNGRVWLYQRAPEEKTADAPAATKKGKK